MIFTALRRYHISPNHVNQYKFYTAGYITPKWLEFEVRRCTSTCPHAVEERGTTTGSAEAVQEDTE